MCARQLISTMRLFTTRAPTMIKGMFGIASMSDGFSLDSIVVQCAVKVGFWQQVAVFLLAPPVMATVPPIVMFVRYQSGRWSGRVSA